MKTHAFLQMPDPDDLEAVERHKRAVFRHFGQILNSIDAALVSALPKVKTLFDLWEGPVDLAVHAPNVRYLVKQFLASRATFATDEDEVHFHMQRVSNCGLCVEAGIGQIRILKATPSGLPKVSSEARTYFVEKNQQLAFRFEQAVNEPRLPSLGLFAAWKMDADHKYISLEIACPRRTRSDGSIECYWVADFKKYQLVAAQRPAAAPKVGEDLEIKRKERKKSVNDSEN